MPCGCGLGLKSNVSESLMVALLLWATWANGLGCYFVKSNRSKLKERMRDEWRERFALGYKKGGNCQKHTKNMNFLSKSLVFCERFAQIMRESLMLLFFKDQRHELITHGRSLKLAILSKRAKRKRATKQIHNPAPYPLLTLSHCDFIRIQIRFVLQPFVFVWLDPDWDQEQALNYESSTKYG